MIEITVQDVKDSLGIDYTDAMIERNITRLISVADKYLKGSVGENYPTSDPRAKELALMVIADLYDERGTSEKVSGNVRRLTNDFSLQLRLEGRDA